MKAEACRRTSCRQRRGFEKPPTRATAGQANLGVAYAKGEGVPQDFVQAHMCFNLAAWWFAASEKENRELAVKNRDRVAAMMTPAQIEEAQKLAREWKPKQELPPKRRRGCSACTPTAGRAGRTNSDSAVVWRFKRGADRLSPGDAMRLLKLLLSLFVCAAGPAVAGPFEDGLTAAQKGDYATALRLWRPLADQGDASAQTRLGNSY